MMNPENFNLCQWVQNYILNINTRTKNLIKVKRIDNEFFRIKYGGEVVIVGISSDPDFRGKFNKAAKIIADNLECEVVNPVDISEYLDKEFKAEYAGSLPYNTYLKADIMQLLFCDGKLPSGRLANVKRRKT